MHPKKDGKWWSCGKCGDGYPKKKAADDCCKVNVWDLPTTKAHPGEK